MIFPATGGVSYFCNAAFQTLGMQEMYSFGMLPVKVEWLHLVAVILLTGFE